MLNISISIISRDPKPIEKTPSICPSACDRRRGQLSTEGHRADFSPWTEPRARAGREELASLHRADRQAAFLGSDPGPRQQESSESAAKLGAGGVGQGGGGKDLLMPRDRQFSPRRSVQEACFHTSTPRRLTALAAVYTRRFSVLAARRLESERQVNTARRTKPAPETVDRAH